MKYIIEVYPGKDFKIDYHKTADISDFCFDHLDAYNIVRPSQLFVHLPKNLVFVTADCPKINDDLNSLATYLYDKNMHKNIYGSIYFMLEEYGEITYLKGFDDIDTLNKLLINFMQLWFEANNILLKRSLR